MSKAMTAQETKNLFVKHEAMLKSAAAAVQSRAFFAHWVEAPSKSVYGETANEDGLAAYQSKCNKPWQGLRQSYDSMKLSSEVSPFTCQSLGISWPVFDSHESYIRKSIESWPAWRKASPELRAGILAEALSRIGKRFFEMAYATMHTTGQGFMMAFQASGPHSNDRALEALSMGYSEQSRFPANVEWKKPMGKFDVVLQKQYKIVPLGISLAIGCSTFPVWNTVPGVFASLVTGNPVIWKPHPGAVYPAAIVVEEIQIVLSENGYDPHICQLCVDTADNPIAKKLAGHPAVKLIDYTGGNAFGNAIESLPGKRTFTEKAGINSLVLHSCNDIGAMMQNIATSLSLYSGQMCTCPQNIFVPKSGIVAGGATIPYEEVVTLLANAVKGLVTHEKAGHATLGAVQNENTSMRVKEAQGLGFRILLDSLKIPNPEFPSARTASHILIEVPADKIAVYEKEMFGPIAFVIPVSDATEGVRLAKELASKHGAITFAAYTTDHAMQELMIEEISGTFTSVSFNFVGPIWVNQSAGFSDFHLTGGNPAGNASLTDPEFVSRRFEIVGIRIHP